MVAATHVRPCDGVFGRPASGDGRNRKWRVVRGMPPAGFRAANGVMPPPPADRTSCPPPPFLRPITQHRRSTIAPPHGVAAPHAAAGSLPHCRNHHRSTAASHSVAPRREPVAPLSTLQGQTQSPPDRPGRAVGATGKSPLHVQGDRGSGLAVAEQGGGRLRWCCGSGA